MVTLAVFEYAWDKGLDGRCRKKMYLQLSMITQNTIYIFKAI